MSLVRGQTLVYVEPYPGPGPALPISSASPLYSTIEWLDDGRIVFLPADRTLVGVHVDTSGAQPVFGEPTPLFGDLRLPSLDYALTADGRRVLVAAPPEESVAGALTLIRNWPAEFGTRAGE